jgi:hypothetical protein
MKAHRVEFEINVARGVKQIPKEVDAELLREALDQIKAAIDQLRSRLPRGKVSLNAFAFDDDESGQHYPPGGCDEPPIAAPVRICENLEEIVRLLREVCAAVGGGGAAV